MRLAPFVFVLLLAPAAFAQPCDPASTDEACPDTTTWQRYFPLDVGNQWQYRDNFYDEPITHWSWTITGQTEVEGQTYFELERCDETDDGSATCADPVLLRYDDTHELILRRTDDGDVWWEVVPCGLGAAFNTGDYFGDTWECTGPAEGVGPIALQGAYGATVAVPPDEVTGDTRKDFEMYPGTGPEMYAGLGVTKFYYDLQEIPTRLVYANVGGEEVGTPAFASCDPADVTNEVACPDTTDWRRYFPLAVGNEWQYQEAIDVGEVVYWGRRITGVLEIEGQTYFEVQHCEEEASGAVSCGGRVPVRYSDEYTFLVRYTEEGNAEWGECVGFPFGGTPQT